MIEGNGYALLPGNCLEALKEYPDGSFASVVCDPPYGLNMATWDKKIPEPVVWAEIFRVAAPGAFLAAFGHPRTWHRLACAIEDAGWCYFDTVGWLFGGGKPASRNRLKPAWNPIVLACKGLDALQIEACRVGKRWPANIIHDGSPEVMALFPDNAGQAAPLAARPSDKNRHCYGAFAGTEEGFEPHDELGSAARFFYCARASATERGADNDCETVKPLELMKYLVKLVTPAEGCVLDPFMGSGTTGIVALAAGFTFVGIEQDPDRFTYAAKRLEAVGLTDGG
jgi:site-specific DNA-methyltransferase (adenine-specific)